MEPKESKDKELEKKEEKLEIFIGGGIELISEEEAEKTKKFINPNATALRNLDADLFGKFKPKYYGFIQQCQLCAFGPCDLSRNRKGACGMRLNLQMSREALIISISGASSYLARASELYKYAVKKYTYFEILNLKKEETAIINLLCGYDPIMVGDLKKALRYGNEQIVHLISSTHMGQEASDFDYNSKALHAGMISLLALEIYEILRKFLYEKEKKIYAKNEIKGNIVVIGEFVKTFSLLNLPVNIIRLGSDDVNYINSIVNYSYEILKYADVIVIGEGNVKCDIIEMAKNVGIPVFATSSRNLAGLADISNLSVDEIFNKIKNKEICGGFINSTEKLTEVILTFVEKNPKETKNPEAAEATGVKNELIKEINISEKLEKSPIILLFGDANFSDLNKNDLNEILNNFLSKNFFVFTAGDIGFSVELKHENLLNLGSKSAGVHLIENLIIKASERIGEIPVGNFDKIAEYIRNKFNIVGIFLGSTTQEDFSISNGVMRLGIPVIFGSQGIKFRREFRGDIIVDYSKDDYNGNYNEIFKTHPQKNFSFPHLCISAKTKDEIITLIPKMVIRS